MLFLFWVPQIDFLLIAPPETGEPFNPKHLAPTGARTLTLRQDFLVRLSKWDISSCEL